jgi:DNA-binding transcriptional ArsR family regulator
MASPNTVFRALADPTRRGILEMLRSGPKNSGEIAERFPLTWATVSRHLAVLREAKLVVAERNGTGIIYELNTTVLEGLAQQLLSWADNGGSDA